jgi:hypothetical protein
MTTTVETYIKRIRNANKKAYAQVFWSWIQAGEQGAEPDYRRSGLGCMAAQAVRTNLYCFRNYGAQHGSIWNSASVTGVRMAR